MTKETVIDIRGGGPEWLDIKRPPLPGWTWREYLRGLQFQAEAVLAKRSASHREFKERRGRLAWRFSYELARDCACDESMLEVFKYLTPDDFEGWFPKELFGLKCFRESAPGTIFKVAVDA